MLVCLFQCFWWNYSWVTTKCMQLEKFTIFYQFVAVFGIENHTLALMLTDICHFHRVMLCKHVISCFRVCLCLSVCLTVCLSDTCHVSKRLNIESHKQCHTIAQGLIDRFWWNLARWCILALWILRVNKIWEFLKLKMAAASILKNKKLRYLKNRLTNFDKICNVDTSRPSGLHLSIKIENYNNPRWRQPTFWRIEKLQ